MARMSDADRQILINAIGTREGTAQELSERYGRSLSFLRSFVKNHKAEIEEAKERYTQDNGQSTTNTEPTPIDFEHLWIANKTARLEKLQTIADKLYIDCTEGGFDAASLREFRSYCAAAANELGQLLNRGSGDVDGETLNVDIQGVDFERLR